MRVTLTATTRSMSQPVERTLTWYNPGTRQIETFKGAMLKFRHVPGLRYMVPEVVEANEPRWLNSWDSIQSWLKKNASSLNVLDLDEGASVVVDVEDVYWPRLETELMQQRILYDSMSDEEVYEMEEKETKKRKNDIWVKQKESYHSGQEPWRAGQVPANPWTTQKNRWF